MFTYNLHQPGEQVRDGMGRDGLAEGSKHLEGTAGVVTWWTAQGRLQRHIAELLLQVEIWQDRDKNMQM